jgi:hypothetical protein
MSSLAPAIYARIARAKQHIKSLQADIQAFCHRNAHEVRHEIDPETAEKIVVYYAREDIPVTWSILIGEIAHNLRSSLDQAVYDLTIRQTGHPLEFSEFPIFTDRDRFNNTGKGGGLYKIRGIPEKTREAIERMQPFNVRSDGKESLTLLLHELSIIDKHRTVHLCRRKTTGMEMRAIRDITFTGNADLFCLPLGKLEDRAILARWKPANGIDDEVYMEANIPFEIALDEATVPTIAGQSVITICEAIVGSVERVMEIIESTLP